MDRQTYDELIKIFKGRALEEAVLEMLVEESLENNEEL